MNPLHWYFEAAPALRLATMRVLLGAYALAYIPINLFNLTRVATLPASHFQPVGPVSLIDSPLPPWAVYSLVALAWLISLAVTVGWQWRIMGPLCAGLLLWITSYASSWGMIFHTENLFVMHALVLAISPAADAWSMDAKRLHSAPKLASGAYGWPLRVMAIITVTTYVLAGTAKLRLAGFEWMDGEVLRVHIAWDAARKLELGSIYSPIAPWLVNYRWLFGVGAVITMAVELGAPIALWGGRIAKVWALTAWTFHMLVVLLMMILFPYALFGIGFAPLFKLENLHQKAPFRWLPQRLKPEPIQANTS